MIKYELLKNPIYLYLLQHPELKDQKINQSAIARELNLNRTTVSTYFKQLYENQIDCFTNIFSITNFFNNVARPLERATYIYLNDIDPNATQEEIANALDCSVASFRGFWFKKEQMVPSLLKAKVNLENECYQNSGVYAILYQNQIIYIGSSSCVSERIKQHKQHIKNKDTISKLYEYCADKEIQLEDLNFIALLYTKDYTAQETKMISTIHPICNIASNSEYFSQNKI